MLDVCNKYGGEEGEQGLRKKRKVGGRITGVLKGIDRKTGKRISHTISMLRYGTSTQSAHTYIPIAHKF